ncbi:hypothetical protein ASG35_18660 [Burkholderia sp. Leaf177]|uniref:BatD family protein n=1 Tax=Burkholderia sp. Leaf177 TaxID=1736287 RepID=UPI000713626B|nr:BatD family protein [Burkholderia sp. Leaf177]KQR74743.1 hypothetical protein ASG35_18660 [Burkholderia sp. Leaf177]
MTSRWILRMCLVVMLLISASAFAQDAPQLKVRAHLEPSGTVVADSEVKLVVDCLTTTFFTEAPDWPLFNVSGALVVLPDEQAENLHETIDGVAWYGVSRAYRIVPQAAGVLTIPAFSISVHPGGVTTPAILTTRELKIAATVPAGAEGMRVFFPTQKLSATQTITPTLHDLKAGGSLTRSITQVAAGTESMLIPPVNFVEVDGLKRYAKPSLTKNVIQDRAGLVAGERTDSVTYVIDHSGRFKLPPVTIEWWNTATQKRESIVLPAISFSASAARERPLFDIPADALSKGGAHRILVIARWQAMLAAMFLVLALVSIWAYPRLAARFKRLRQALHDARKRHADGDGPAWRALRIAARNGPLKATIPLLYRWMDRSRDLKHPAMIDELKSSAELRLDELVSAVHAHYSGQPQAELNSRESIKALGRAVKHTRKSRKAKSPLPPLNKY